MKLCLFALATFLVVVVGHATREVHELGEERQAVVDLWTHTAGAPRGQSVHLSLPDGDSEAVAKIVARKNIERAAAGLHHATVMAKQEAERMKVANEADESALTKLKIGRTRMARISRQIKDDNEHVEKLQSRQANVVIKSTEASAKVQTVSKKKKKAAMAAAKLAKARATSTNAKLSKAQSKLSSDEYKIVGAKADVQAQTEREDKTRLTAVAERVKNDAAEHAKLRAQFMSLKSKNLSKLAIAKYSKEVWRKKKKQGKNNVKGAREMVEVMGSGPGKKEATAALARAKKRAQHAAKKYAASRKQVNTVKNHINAGEVKWAKKMAYNAVWKTAQAGAASNKADKAFQMALSAADKQAKKVVAAQANKEMTKATKNAEKATANFEHVRFAAIQDKKARERTVKKEKKADALEQKKANERKRKNKMAKKALSNTGKSPK